MKQLIKVKAIKTNCRTKKPEDILVGFGYQDGIGKYLEGSVWLHIVSGGVTGYESFEYKPETEDRMRKDGWCACAGTDGRWNTLEIPAKSMARVFDEYKKTKV